MLNYISIFINQINYDTSSESDSENAIEVEKYYIYKKMI